MTVQMLLSAITLGLCGLLVISFIVTIALDDREWPYYVLVVVGLLLIAIRFTAWIVHDLGLDNAVI